MKKNKYSTPLWMLATILAGMLSPMQSAVNGQLGHWLQDGNACAVISFSREGANKRGNSSRLTQSFHFFMFEPIFSPVNALNQPI